jgi:hypothetical protein
MAYEQCNYKHPINPHPLLGLWGTAKKKKFSDSKKQTQKEL